ncbi:MAG TPA: TonB-dependent receptor [Thermoanaerobaculia bacterium]|nr:TonB-dependent receptor [Thermoanaerobaculia bacterium]
MCRPLSLLLLLLLLFPVFLTAQSLPQATITGKVTAGGSPLPGVTVSVSSPQLQGTRNTVTTAEGDYLLPLLPPGDYTVSFELEGMQTQQRTVTLTASRTHNVNADLRPTAVAESITVTAETPLTAAVESTQVSTNFKQDFVELLPVQRNLESVTLLAPGVTPNGPGGNLMISGAMSFDSLYLINGAIANENLRGQPHDLFIEDAIQETTVLTGAISAEYGHFTGGVVNAITKSGGNDLKGSVRVNFTNESWVAETPFTVEQADTINDVYEATVGGPLLRDRVWFFGAGRLQESEDVRQTRPGAARTGDEGVAPLTYPHGTEETRLEGKLTGAITPKHNVVLSYMDIDDVETNSHFDTILDLDSLNAQRENPQSLLALNYSGTLTSRLFLEAQYSDKEYGIMGTGSRFTDLIRGTFIIDRARDARYNSPTFKYKPEGEQRNHELFTVKGTYFWSTASAGTHDIRAGYEDFSEVRLVNNYGSGSDFRISIPNTIIRGNQIFPRMPGGNSGTLTRIEWRPIFVESQGSDYASTALFLNDRWTLNEKWTFNLGVRYDKNDAVSGDRTFKIADDAAFSPRLAAHYDLFGNGRIVANASYGQYVGRLSEGVGNDGDPAGRAGTISWNYRGPSINNNVNAATEDLIPTHEALAMIFEWFFENGGYDRRPHRSVSIPGIDTIIVPGTLTSPNVKEYTLGLGSVIGTRGYARADFIYRNWDDFYTDFTTLETGRTTDDFGNEYDLTVIENSDIYDREYTAVQTQVSYRLLDRVNLGGTYTWSRLVGNVTGENSGDGPTSGNAMNYPEYRAAEWNYPMGYLTGDQRHRLKAWASYDVPITFGRLNLSLLQNFDSGGRTSTEGSIDVTPSGTTFIENPGYLTPPNGIDYFFGGRGNVKHENITRTDLALNFGVNLGRFELFLQPEVLNIFNEQGLTSFNEEILTNSDVEYLAAFNPYTTTAIECPQGAAASECEALGAHWQKGENFGEPSGEGSYQTPRTFRFSVGVRF